MPEFVQTPLELHRQVVEALDLGAQHVRWSRDRSSDAIALNLNEQDVRRIESALTALRSLPIPQGTEAVSPASPQAAPAGGMSKGMRPMFDSLEVSAMWQEFCRSHDYRQALQWAANEESPGALFVAFRSGLAAALSPSTPTEKETGDAI